MIKASKAILLTRVLSNGFQIPAQEKGSRGQKHQSQVPIYRKCHLIDTTSRGSQIHLEKHIKEKIQKTEILCDQPF